MHWTQIVGPPPPTDDRRRLQAAHELFHRIQPDLGLTRSEQPNQHLDTLEGRYLLQLEWRALAAALASSTEAEQRSAIVDALGFRHDCDIRFPDAAPQERALEINEEVPQYTGV